jgi:hypothetical protein
MALCSSPTHTAYWQSADIPWDPEWPSASLLWTHCSVTEPPAVTMHFGMKVVHLGQQRAVKYDAFHSVSQRERPPKLPECEWCWYLVSAQNSLDMYLVALCDVYFFIDWVTMKASSKGTLSWDFDEILCSRWLIDFLISESVTVQCFWFYCRKFGHFSLC